MRKISATPALQIIGAYTANDCVGALLTFTYESGSVPNHKTVKLRRLIIADADKEKAEFYLWLFDASPTAAARTDADAFAPAAADIQKIVGVVHIAAADYVDSASDSWAVEELDYPVISAAGASIFGVLVCVGTPTYTAANDLVVSLYVED